MTKEKIQEVLDELQTVRPEMLNNNAKRLFEAIMSIADERDILKQRIDKAIKILNDRFEYDDGDFESMRFQNDVIKTLQGEDNE